jgi:hypothetical protein
MSISQFEQAKQFYELLGGGVREIRAIKNRSVVVGYYDDAEQFAHGVQEINRQGYNVYTNLNPLNAGFKATNTFEKGKACGAADIARIHFALIDIDATRFHPKDSKICTTDAEHKAGLKFTQAVKKYLLENGCPKDAIIDNDSGNGGALLIRIDLPNNSDSTNLLKRFLQGLAQRHDNEKAHVDICTFDSPRITRAPGSKNNKLSTKDRPNRIAYTISAPKQLEVAPLEFLNKVAGTAIVPKEEPEAKIELDAMPEGELKEKIEMVIAYCRGKKIPPTNLSRNEAKRFTAVNLPHCPIKGSGHQSPGRAAILVFDDGRIGFHCFSAKCSEKSFKDVQDKLGSFAAFCAKHFDKTNREFDDPIRFAQKHIAKNAMPDGTPTYAHFLNETHSYGVDGWQPLANGEEDAWIRDTIQKENDNLAKYLSRLNSEEVKPEPVTVHQVHETRAAIESLCRHRISKKTQPPFWLSKHDWDTKDVLVFANGFFNLKQWLDGKEFFIPRTAKLYYEYQAKFDYLEQAKCPVWLEFLTSLGQAEDWYKQLQQASGYLLWSGFDLQKFLHIFGPPRAGKNVITGVMGDMGGGFCSMMLDDFCEPFGLEKAIGQRIIFVPETEKGPNKHPVSAVVSVIKTITGGGEVPVNRKNIKNISMRLPGKIVMQGNAPLTSLSDNSGALLARYIPIKLTKSFVGREDTKLADKLKLEYSGIFLWCLGGLRSVVDAGKFTLCESTKRELEHMRDSSAPIQAFIEDCCIVDPAKGVNIHALHRIYELWWQEEHSVDAWKEEQFGIELRMALPAIDRQRLSSKKDMRYKDVMIIATDYDAKSERPWVYLGICPKPERCSITVEC